MQQQITRQESRKRRAHIWKKKKYLHHNEALNLHNLFGERNILKSFVYDHIIACHEGMKQTYKTLCYKNWNGKNIKQFQTTNEAATTASTK